MYISDVRVTTFGRSDCTNRIFPEHSAGVNRLYYVNKGDMLLKTGNEEILMQNGHLYLLPHYNINTISTDYVDHSYVHFYTFPQILNEKIVDIDLSNHLILKHAFDALNLFITDNPGKNIPCKNDPKHIFVSTMLSNIIFLIWDISGLDVVNDEFVNDVIEYIHEKHNTGITVTELADKFHMEQNSFIRRFKKYANVTPYKYLKRVRVNMALALMKGDKYDLSEIAKKVGYSDASTLSHAMKKCITM